MGRKKNSPQSHKEHEEERIAFGEPCLRVLRAFVVKL
jgi:hypothetical protein